jgi:hypothetical protein
MERTPPPRRRTYPSARLPHPQNPNSPLRDEDNASSGPGTRRLNELSLPEVETIIANRFHELTVCMDESDEFVDDNGNLLDLDETQERVSNRRLATVINMFNVVVRLIDYIDTRYATTGHPSFDRGPLQAAHQWIAERIHANDARFRAQHPDAALPSLPDVPRPQRVVHTPVHIIPHAPARGEQLAVTFGETPSRIRTQQPAQEFAGGMPGALPPSTTPSSVPPSTAATVSIPLAGPTFANVPTSQALPGAPPVPTPRPPVDVETASDASQVRDERDNLLAETEELTRQLRARDETIARMAAAAARLTTTPASQFPPSRATAYATPPSRFPVTTTPSVAPFLTPAASPFNYGLPPAPPAVPPMAPPPVMAPFPPPHLRPPPPP